MAYKKFNIYEGVRISGKVLTGAIIAGIAAMILLMVIGSRNGFTVHFESSGGSEIAEQHLRYGEKVREPSVPTRPGYTFEGWYSDAARTKRTDFSHLSAADDMTFYAMWQKNDIAVGKEINENEEITENEAEELN